MRLWNMALVMPITLCALLVCSAPVETKANDEPPRFEYQRAVHTEAIDTYVMTDTVTGVQYVVIFGQRLGHISIDVTPLLDVNGKPYREVSYGG